MKCTMSISLVLSAIFATVLWGIGDRGKLTATALNPSPRQTLGVENNLPNGKTLSASDRPSQKLAANDCDPKSRYGCPDDPRSPSFNCDTPIIISPYDTALLNDRPPISWYAVPGAVSYTVRVKDITGSGLDWERPVNSPSQSAFGEIKIDYPADVEALQLGGRYKLIVEARLKSTEKPATPGESLFRMLDREDIQQVRDIVEKVDNSNLPKEEKVLQQLYDVYISRNLIAEIIERLEALVRDGTQKAQVYRTLGDLYRQQGLYDSAKPRYETAIDLARTAQDTQESAAAKDGLKKINEVPTKQCELTP